eukprot:CAMPEP_0172821660 /NCGR_PEP_ID=MMETSP1075-20121228/16124_1 /TAXON_ID=2916 /ORGANISM="Ceratium fusus, Strain PA161109" /LENGTH=98 /DNA_ID=CAMNT_0013662541 /DNA_START=149 /DNA_END=442 /DNA_ORIENTATION=-
MTNSANIDVVFCIMTMVAARPAERRRWVARNAIAPIATNMKEPMAWLEEGCFNGLVVETRRANSGFSRRGVKLPGAVKAKDPMPTANGIQLSPKTVAV